MRDIEALKRTIPLEHTSAWHEARFGCCNSSGYSDVFNRYNSRHRALSMSARGVRTIPTFPMCWGSKLEDCSSYIFSHLTGLEYEDLGSVEHARFPRIRGTVDGYNEEGWILETKTPSSRKPAPSLNSAYYYYQVIQNIEILEADYGFFNNVFIRPMLSSQASSDLFYEAVNPMFNSMYTCTFERNGLACVEDKPCYALMANIFHKDVHSVLPPAEGTRRSRCDYNFVTDETLMLLDSIDDSGDYNYSDLYLVSSNGTPDTKFEISRRNTLFHTFIMSNRYNIVPASICDSEDIEGWMDSLPTDPSAIGKIFFKVDCVSIDRVERQQEFWESTVLPIANQWIHNIDDIREGRVPRTPIYDIIPLPADIPFDIHE